MHYRLSPFDCAVIGKFISSLLTHYTGSIPLDLRLRYCNIGEYGLEQFLEPVFFTLHSLAHSTTVNKSSNELWLDLHDNHLTHKSVEKLKHVLTLQSNPITRLRLSDNFDHSMTNKYVALKHLIECLAHKECSLYFSS